MSITSQSLDCPMLFCKCIFQQHNANIHNFLLQLANVSVSTVTCSDHYQTRLLLFVTPSS